jgi:hypothetical protein
MFAKMIPFNFFSMQFENTFFNTFFSAGKRSEVRPVRTKNVNFFCYISLPSPVRNMLARMTGTGCWQTYWPNLRKQLKLITCM